MENQKLEQEELNRIQEIQSRMRTVEQQFGQITLAELNLHTRTDNVKTYLKNTQEMERELALELENKYGNGSIDLQQGEFIPNRATSIQEVESATK